MFLLIAICETVNGRDMKNIYISLKDINVLLLPGDEFKIEYNDVEPELLDVHSTPNELTIEQKKRTKRTGTIVLGMVFVDNFSHLSEITVYIPESKTQPIESCHFKLESSVIAVQELSFNALSVDLKNGEIGVDKVHAQDLRLNCVNAQLHLHNTSLDTLNIRCNNGSVGLEHLQVANGCSIELGNGPIAIKDAATEDNTLDLSCENGGMTIFGRHIRGSYAHVSNLSDGPTYTVDLGNGHITVM